MENKRYKVIGISSYEGTSKNGQRYTLYALELDVDGQKAKIKTFENNVRIGDFVEIGVGLRKSIYGNELTAVVVEVHPSSTM